MKARGEIRERDANGNLVAAGFEWTNRSFWQFVLLLVVIIFCACAVIALILASDSNLETMPHLIIAGLFLAFAWLTYQYRKRRNRRKGAVIFHADGQISLPHGLPGYAAGRRFNDPWTEIASIAAEQEYVRIYFRDGDVVTVTYPPADATVHKVSVQLQLALTAIRDAVAQAAVPGRVVPTVDAPIRID